MFYNSTSVGSRATTRRGRWLYMRRMLSFSSIDSSHMQSKERISHPTLIAKKSVSANHLLFVLLRSSMIFSLERAFPAFPVKSPWLSSVWHKRVSVSGQTHRARSWRQNNLWETWQRFVKPENTSKVALHSVEISSYMWDGTSNRGLMRLCNHQKPSLTSLDSDHQTSSTSVNPFTPESDQCQNSPAASQEIWHHIVWRTWLFIAYSDERWLYYKFSLQHSYIAF